MKRNIQCLYKKIELYRYKILKKDASIATIFRGLIRLFYPIFGSRLFLNSRLVNHRNREAHSIYNLVNEASCGNETLKKDMILCYYYYHILPWEYNLYHFEKQSHKERLCWLSDTDRYMICELLMGSGPYWTLKDKSKFYNMVKQYYKRPIFQFLSSTKESELEEFMHSNDCDLFVKPIDGSLGRDTFKVLTNAERLSLYNKLIKTKGNWLIEGAIVQSSKMSEWNHSSVNTVRIPSIRAYNQWHILQPFFRTGRKGQIVDNAGAGGILCVVDEETGFVTSNGFDESSNVYETHPDSTLRYKGWKLPEYKKLVELTKQIHEALPVDFIYVGFDFALTDNGWDLIEGNWGQFVGQIAAQKGIKKEFDDYIGIK